MKVSIAITASNGDTLVRKIKLPGHLYPTKYTDYFITNKILDSLGEPILEIVRVFQEVDDAGKE